MTCKTIYTLAIRDHQLDDEAHDLVTLEIECETSSNPTTARVIMESIDAALNALREDLIKSARFYAETRPQ